MLVILIIIIGNCGVGGSSDNNTGCDEDGVRIEKQ